MDPKEMEAIADLRAALKSLARAAETCAAAGYGQLVLQAVSDARKMAFHALEVIEPDQLEAERPRSTRQVG
jgi:hypothetical protein